MQAENKSNASGYILILVCIILILALIIVALALYRRIAVNNKVDRKQIPEAVRTAPEFESMNELDKQYDPKKDFEGSGFGGIRFDR
jgi:flagellar basal body-associated protein FliL